VRLGEEPGRLSGWQALALGIAQGATELLPISSSGHLILVPWLAEWRYLQSDDDFNQTFGVALHLGTLAAVVLYFRADIVRYAAAWWRSVRLRRVDGVDARIAWALVVATIPAAAAGAAGEAFIVERLGEPWQIAIFLAVFGVLLYVADRLPQRRGLADLDFRTAAAIGASQVLALAPGVSRSGVTITAARFARMDRDAAARFSFLLLVPITFGAVVYEGVTDVLLDPLPAGWTGPFVVGTLAAAAVGLLAIELLLGYVRRHDYTPFVVYRLLAAGVIALLILTGARMADF
jgi:undecaprenyl-diphosphatase